MASVALFQEHRKHLFAIAYRMLGAVSEAEDILQETYLRWREVDVSVLRSPTRYLSTMIARASIDRLRKQKSLREDYIGPWLPEPIVGQELITPNANTVSESVSIAFLVLLERLSPTERAVFLLREVFDYEYAEIAEIVEKEEDNCRQLFRRARAHIESERPRFSATADQQWQLAIQFQQAIAKGDLSELVSLLSENIRANSDGGGQVSAARACIVGKENVARFLLGVRRFSEGLIQTPVILNGQPGVVIGDANTLHSAAIIHIDCNQVRQIHIIRNPDKLSHIRDWLKKRRA